MVPLLKKNKTGIITTRVRTRPVMPTIARHFMSLVLLGLWANRRSLRLPGRPVLEDHLFQRALNFRRGWIDGTGILVSLSFFDGLPSRVENVLPGNRGLVQNFSTGVRRLKSEMDFLDWLVGVHLDLVRDVCLVGGDPPVCEFNPPPTG